MKNKLDLLEGVMVSMCGMNIDQFIDSQLNDGEFATMTKIFDFQTGKSYDDQTKEPVRKGGAH